MIHLSELTILKLKLEMQAGDDMISQMSQNMDLGNGDESNYITTMLAAKKRRDEIDDLVKEATGYFGEKY